MVQREQLRVLLVEDDLDVAAGISDYLSSHQIDVDYAGSARQALHLLANARFDLLILDVQLPGEDGVRLCQRLKQEMGVDAPVLFLTAQGGLQAKLSGFAAGAIDYVVKPFAPAELLARVRAIGGHSNARTEAAVCVGPYRLQLQRCLLWREKEHLALTALTSRLMAELMQAHPGWVSRADLCEALWHDEVPDSDPLRAHIHHLRRALQSTFGEPLIATLRGVGYRFSLSDHASSSL